MMREQFGDEGKDLTFVLMNSFSTSDDTKAYLAKYEPSVGPVDDLEFVQNKSPKVTFVKAGASLTAACCSQCSLLPSPLRATPTAACCYMY